MAGKKLAEAAAKIDRTRLYHPAEALELARETNPTKFDATVEVAFRLGVDPRRADQMVRGTVSLPNGTGKTIRVAVFAEGEPARLAEEAGADVVGGKDLVERVQGGFLDFDAAVAVPEMMGQVGRLGRILGPRGLMPNPRAGTVTPDVARAVSDIKGGKVEYRVDRHGNLHLILGKTSFAAKALVENYQVVLDEILRAKPAAAKGRYIKGITVATSMGPGIKVDPGATRNLASTAAGACRRPCRSGAARSGDPDRGSGTGRRGSSGGGRRCRRRWSPGSWSTRGCTGRCCRRWPTGRRWTGWASTGSSR